MSIRGSVAVAGVEWSKLFAQLKVRLALGACVAGPFTFAAAMRLQSSLPTDTLFGRWVTDSSFALPLVVLGFAAFWVFPVFASIVGGDVFSAEDRYGTWSAVLTRSRSRAEVFAGKVVTALAFSAIAVAVLAVSSIAAGVLIIGGQPLINLSGSPAVTRPLLMTSAFDAWHGFLTAPPYFGPLLYGTTVSLLYIAVCLAVAYRLLLRRDIGR